MWCGVVLPEANAQCTTRAVKNVDVVPLWMRKLWGARMVLCGAGGGVGSWKGTPVNGVTMLH